MEDYWINVSDVKDGRDQPQGPLAAVDAGLWHNYVLYVTFGCAQEVGFGPESAPKWIEYIRTVASSLKDAEQQAVNRIADALAQAQLDGPVDSLVEPLQSIFADVAGNPELNQSTACVAASIAYRSSQFWSEVTIADTGARFPSPRQIVHIVAADVVGAIGGAATGLGIAQANNPNDPNAANNGVIIGAIVGGVAASTYTATEPKP